MNFRKPILNGYKGRNGIGSIAGVRASPLHQEKCIVLNPINSKRQITMACWIAIPVEDIGAFIDELRQAAGS